MALRATSSSAVASLIQSSNFYGSFTRWKVAKARGAANPARILVLGDSNVTNAGGGDSGSFLLVNALTSSWAQQLARLAGYKVDSFYGEGNCGANVVTPAQYDPRIVLGTGWTYFTSPTILGGRMVYTATHPNTNLLTFTPVGAFDSFDCILPIVTGTIGVWVDGTQVATVNTAALTPIVGGIGKVTYTVTRGTHTIGFSNPDITNFTYVSGVQCHDSTNAAPELIQASWFGAVAANFTANANAWEQLNGVQAVKADYSIVPIIENDSSSGTALATYQAAMETTIANLAATSDGCICASFASNNAASLNGDFDTRAQMLKNLARSYGWSYFDMRDVYGYSWAKATTNGYVYDTSHPNRAGYTAMVTKLYAFLTASGL